MSNPLADFYNSANFWWRQVSFAKAKKDKIIKCCACPEPAVQLDHLYPYEGHFNRCINHLEEVE